MIPQGRFGIASEDISIISIRCSAVKGAMVAQAFRIEEADLRIFAPSCLNIPHAIFCVFTETAMLACRLTHSSERNMKLPPIPLLRRHLCRMTVFLIPELCFADRTAP